MTADVPAFTIDHAAATPIYRQITDGLRQWLLSAPAVSGQALPGERLLATRLGVSRVTVRQALDQLRSEGLLVRRRGSGTFVQPRRIEHTLNALSSFSDDMRARALTPGAQVLNFSLGHATTQESMSLGLGAHSRVYRIERLRTADGVPMALESSVLPEERVGLLSAAALVDQSLYALLGARQVQPVRALRQLRAVSATAAQATLLAVAPGAPLLQTERVSWTAAGVPIELAQACYRGDRYDFLMELSVPG